MKHPLHSICPYFAMFPEGFVTRQLYAYTSPGDQVFDPFCGRGTTILEGLLRDRNASGSDINPVAVCISGAKADPPTLQEVKVRLDDLERRMTEHPTLDPPAGDFFRACFHKETLQQLLFLRETLNWTDDPIDRFIAAVALGCLHGESHKSPHCFSNRMPRTISTKPDYSVRWWGSRGLEPPQRDVFSILRHMSTFRLSTPPARIKGSAKLSDARKADNAFPELNDSVGLIVTSPPYLDTTDFREDQWLRLWFLGGPERPQGVANSDDRHTSTGLYWKFLAEAWAGCSSLMKSGSIIVVRIGGARVTKEDIFSGLNSSLAQGFQSYKVAALHDGTTTEIKNRQTNVFRPGTSSQRFEHDFAFQLS